MNDILLLSLPSLKHAQTESVTEIIQMSHWID